MLRGILSRMTGRRGRGTVAPGGTGRRTGAGGGNREIQQGARSLFRGFSRKRRGL